MKFHSCETTFMLQLWMNPENIPKTTKSVALKRAPNSWISSTGKELPNEAGQQVL